MKNIYLKTIFISVIIGFGAFLGGIKYQESKNPVNNFQFNDQARNNLCRGINSTYTREDSEAVRGEVLSKDEKTITVKLSDDSSKIVLFSETTQINKAETATLDDIDIGSQVMVLGQKNQDGSVSARSIQLNSQGRPM